MLSAELRQKAEQLVARYPVGRSALLPLLHLVQAQDGYVTDDGIVECAELLGLSRAEVGAVATFYTMYKRVPLGEHLISVCTNFSCKVRGAQQVYDRLSEKLGVGHNETTADGKLTLEHAECLGNCEGAPVVTVDYFNYECLSPDDAEALVDAVVAGDPPPPTRGLVPPGIRPIEYRLSGLGPRDDAPADDRGARLGFADAEAGGLVPARTAEAGPDAQVVGIEPEFSEEREAERQQAKQAVREAGQDPDEVEGGAGPGAREFPTRDADWESQRPGDAPGGSESDDAREEEQVDG